MPSDALAQAVPFNNDMESVNELIEQIYEKYHKQMEYVAFQVLQNKQDAEDAVQDAFIALTAHAETIHGMEDFRVYYYVTEAAKNKAIDLLRRRKKIISYDDLLEQPDNDDDFTERIAQRDAVDEMLGYIKRLPPHYRDVLSLCYVNSLSSKQIAETLGRSDAAVRKQLQRGRELLLRQWKEHHHD